ncbi:hypothetical protein HAX54_018179, partial [Datura stramonium]|nr:hypothetical protein [Datura stramonium]
GHDKFHRKSAFPPNANQQSLFSRSVHTISLVLYPFPFPPIMYNASSLEIGR